MESKNLVLVGGGGHCKSVIDVAESAGYNILGILDLSNNVGNILLGYPIVGTDESILEWSDKAMFMITVGQIKYPNLRVNLFNKIMSAGAKFATIISPNAYVSKHAIIGEGTVVMHNSVVNAGAIIGKCCIINTFANIEHDARIGNFSHISTGAIVNGNCKVGSETFLGSQSVLVNNVEIIDGCVIGAGSLVLNNLKEKGVYTGNPVSLKIKLK